jgi:hypothetical protein
MKQQHSKTRSRNSLSTAIALALTAAATLPTYAYAQQATTTTDAQATPAQQTTKTPEQLDAVTVTGYRYSIEKSLDQKRNANAIVEVITAEDVGKFPDKNVADALVQLHAAAVEHAVQRRAVQDTGSAHRRRRRRRHRDPAHAPSAGHGSQFGLHLVRSHGFGHRRRDAANLRPVFLARRG